MLLYTVKYAIDDHRIMILCGNFLISDLESLTKGMNYGCIYAMVLHNVTLWNAVPTHTATAVGNERVNCKVCTS